MSTIETDSTPARVAASYLNVPEAELQITPLKGDASTRAYFRARARDSSIIVVQYSSHFDETVSAADRLAAAETSDAAARLTFANDPCAHIEVTQLFLNAGVPVPRILASLGADATLLIEDVGDERLQDWLSKHSQTEAFESYKDALQLVVKIQEATDFALQPGCICSKLAFDEAKLRWELGFFFANYFNRFLKAKLDASTSTAVQQDFKILCVELASRPRVLTHRDFHARNLMVHEERLFVIDHQDARMGPVSYDVASLLSDPYTTIDRPSIDELVDIFVSLKAASGMPIPDVGDFRLELQLMTVQRMLKAIGTYASQAAIGNRIYVPYIEPALNRALGAIESTGRFDATRRLLESTRV